MAMDSLLASANWSSSDLLLVTETSFADLDNAKATCKDGIANLKYCTAGKRAGY